MFTRWQVPKKRPLSGNERRYRGFETQVWHSLLTGKICKKKFAGGTRNMKSVML